MIDSQVSIHASKVSQLIDLILNSTDLLGVPCNSLSILSFVYEHAEQENHFPTNGMLSKQTMKTELTSWGKKVEKVKLDQQGNPSIR